MAGDARGQESGGAVALGRLALAVATVSLVVVSLPVVVRGALLADDFNNCLAPQELGLGGFLSQSLDRLGLIRPARFLEILLTTTVCQHLPFGVAVATGLALTLVVALLLRRLLTLLGVPQPWPDLAAAVWLLQPLGTEAALWPAALHVPLGLALALGALISFRAARVGLGVFLGVTAMLCIEQAIPVLPVAAWLVSPPPRRRVVAGAMAAAVVVLGSAFALFPASDPRLSAGVGDRFRSLVADPGFLLRYPAVGVGAESIPMAVRWAAPAGLAVLALAAVAVSWWFARASSTPRIAGVQSWKVVLAFLLLAVLANLPILLSVPRQGSPRTFAPTWLLAAACLGVLLARVRLRYPRTTGAVVGLYLGGAILSLALSAWVRVENADVVERVADRVAEQTTDGDLVALCDVPRSAASPAPRGAFAVQDFVYDWAAADAVRYHTGRRATFHVHLSSTGGTCDDDGANLTVPFEDLSGDDD